MSGYIEIDEVPHGTRAQTKCTLGSDPLEPVCMPVWISRGTTPGSVLTVVSGVHGCEYAGIVAASQVFHQLDPTRLSGDIVFLPVVNPPAFRARSQYVCPVDMVNMNRAFPGSSCGSLTFRMAKQIFTHFVSRSTHLVDLHGGDLFERMLSHTGYVITGKKEVDDQSLAMARAFTDRYFQAISIQNRPIGGALFIEASNAGIPSIIAEAGSEGRIDGSAVEYHESGLYSVLQTLGMYDSCVRSKALYESPIEGEITIRAESGGLFFPSTDVGSTVYEDEELGEIRDLEGHCVSKIRSPFVSGVVMLLFTRSAVNTGDPVLLLWKTG